MVLNNYDVFCKLLHTSVWLVCSVIPFKGIISFLTSEDVNSHQSLCFNHRHFLQIWEVKKVLQATISFSKSFTELSTISFYNLSFWNFQTLFFTQVIYWQPVVLVCCFPRCDFIEQWQRFYHMYNLYTLLYVLSRLFFLDCTHLVYSLFNGGIANYPWCYCSRVLTYPINLS